MRLMNASIKIAISAGLKRQDYGNDVVYRFKASSGIEYEVEFNLLGNGVWGLIFYPKGMEGSRKFETLGVGGAKGVFDQVAISLGDFLQLKGGEVKAINMESDLGRENFYTKFFGRLLSGFLLKKSKGGQGVIYNFVKN